ncbi:MAG: restriction endonuclease subunit S [Bacteroidota bacterium]|nr:restriction endonuclease subunit S [Bacteroidota bacterium]
MKELYQLPKEWKRVKLGEVATYLNGRAFKPTEWKDIGKPIIRIQNLNKPEAKYNYTKEQFEERYKVVKGDLLFAWSASLGAYIWKGDEAWLNQHIFKVVPKNFTDKTYLFYLLEKIVQELYAKAHGSGMVHVTKGKFEATEIPFPPKPTQEAIVSKIEELFSELEKGIESLFTAQQQLKTYRQSVLKWAFEGKLTNSLNYDSNDLHEDYDLNIAAEDEAEYQTKKNQGNQNNQINHSSDKGELPKGWKEVLLKDVCKIIGGVTKGRDFKRKETIHLPYLRVANVQDGYLDLEEMKTIEVLPSDKDKYKLLFGDILYTEGGDKDKLGRGTIWRNEVDDCIHQNHIFRARPLSREVDPKYIAYFSQTRSAKNYFFKNGKQTTNLASINLTILSNLPLPLCSLKEQNNIVQEIESRLSVADKMEESITQSLRQAEALRQSILKKAFEGRLI